MVVGLRRHAADHERRRGRRRRRRWSARCPPSPTDVGALFYTSGTTGKPKGAELTHRGLIEGVTAAALFPSGIRRDELVMALPVAHIFGFMMVLGAACAGVPVYFLPKFNPVKVLDAIEQRGLDRVRRRAGHVPDADRRRRGGPQPVDDPGLDLGRRRHARRAGQPLQGHGRDASASPVSGPWARPRSPRATAWSRPAGGVAIRLSLPMVPVHLGGSVGVPLPGYKFRVVDDDGKEVGRNAVGELLVSGPGHPQGLPRRTRGHRRGPDRGRLAPHRRPRPARPARHRSRSKGGMKDVIKRGGYSVYAVEVEQALEEHPDVVEAAVVPLPDERDGEVPGAAVRLRDGRRPRRPRPRGVGQGAPVELQGPGAVRRGRRLPPHRHRQGPTPRGRQAVLTRRRRRQGTRTTLPLCAGRGARAGPPRRRRAGARAAPAGAASRRRCGRAGRRAAPSAPPASAWPTPPSRRRRPSGC